MSACCRSIIKININNSYQTDCNYGKINDNYDKKHKIISNKIIKKYIVIPTIIVMRNEFNLKFYLKLKTLFQFFWTTYDKITCI